jgi:hypothetical protein
VSEQVLRRTVVIGGREVPILVAALIAQDAARLEIPPCQVGDVAMPEPAPATVELAGHCVVSIEVGAQLAAEADAKGLRIGELMSLIVNERLDALDRRARRRDTCVPLEGAWMLPSDPGRRKGPGGNHGGA